MTKNYVIGVAVMMVLCIGVVAVFAFQMRETMTGLAASNAKQVATIKTLETKLNACEKMTKNDVLYTDRDGRVAVRVPYGWEIQRTEYWDALRIKGTGEVMSENIVVEYEPEVVKPGSTLLQSLAERNEGVFGTDTAKKAYPGLVMPRLTILEQAGRSAVLEECESVTVRGGGFACTKSGAHFLRRLSIENAKGGIARLTILTDSERMRSVNLAEWADRVIFLK